MIASLPMYDRPETRDATDRLWHLTRDRLPAWTDAPRALMRDDDPWAHWLSPDLFLSQTCGLPYRLRLRDAVTLVAAPVHDLGDPPGCYHSVLVARAADPRDAIAAFAGARLAVNDRLSQSGWAAPQVMARRAGFVFGAILTTGSHRASAVAVSDGTADIAAIDAVTWTLTRRHDPDIARLLKVIGRTPPTPALPYITAVPSAAHDLHAALAGAVDALSEDDRRTLCLSGLARVSPDDYLGVPLP